MEVNTDGETNEVPPSSSDTSSSSDKNDKTKDKDDDFKMDPKVFYDYFKAMYAANPKKQKEIDDLFEKYKGKENEKKLMDILMKMMYSGQDKYGYGYGGGYGGGGYGGDYYKPPPRKKPKVRKTGKAYVPTTSHFRAVFEGTFELYDDGDTNDDDDYADDSNGRPLPFVVWMAPFFSGGGYCSEALSYIEYLASIDGMADRIHIVQHGDSINYEYANGLSEHHQTLLARLSSNPLPTPSLINDDDTVIVVICHSEPGAWFPPNYQTSACPPHINITEAANNEFDDLSHDHQIMRYDNVYYIGRTMFETDRLPNNWDAKLNTMDEIWVPTSFHNDIFRKYGNLTSDTKLWTLPQSVNTTFYAPDASFSRVNIFELFGLRGVDPDAFVFVSVFKWEERKGWKYLLQAYLSEFASNDNVELIILTNAYHTSDDFEAKIVEFIKSEQYLSERLMQIDENGGDMLSQLASLHVVPGPVANDDMPKFYQMGDCFVLPSRGEGWGRPHVEAMSMGLAVIATGWSGPTQYIEHERNGYLIDVDGMEEIEDGAFRGHKWAKPKVDHLKKLMRNAVDNKEYLKDVIGKNAQIDMRKKYCIECVGKILGKKLKQFTAKK